jgi:hypothetical protein
LHDKDRCEAVNVLSDLLNWLANDGFFPDAEEAASRFQESIPYDQSILIEAIKAGELPEE